MWRSDTDDGIDGSDNGGGVSDGEEPAFPPPSSPRFDHFASVASW